MQVSNTQGGYHSKKKSCEFSQFGGGSSQKFDINLDDYQLNIDFFQHFWGVFKGEFFFILHIMVFW